MVVGFFNFILGAIFIAFNPEIGESADVLTSELVLFMGLLMFGLGIMVILANIVRSQ
jgi:hypothetical protein